MSGQELLTVVHLFARRSSRISPNSLRAYFARATKIMIQYSLCFYAAVEGGNHLSRFLFAGGTLWIQLGGDVLARAPNNYSIKTLPQKRFLFYSTETKTGNICIPFLSQSRRRNIRNFRQKC